MNLIPLSPNNYECKANDNLNKISYFYLDGTEGISHNSYEIFEKLIEQKLKNVKNYNSFSIYVYKKTNRFNGNFKGDNNSFDGYNNDLLVYDRYGTLKESVIFFIF